METGCKRIWLSRYFYNFLWIAPSTHILWIFSGFYCSYFWILFASVVGPLVANFLLSTMGNLDMETVFERICSSRYFYSFLWIAPLMHMLWLLSGYLWPYFLTLLASLVGPLVASVLTNTVGNRSVDRLYGLNRKDITPQQRFAGELDKIRFLKREKDFERALHLVNKVLEREPDFPEALYLKAQILWEGFENRKAAESYFGKIIQLVKEDEPFHRWASGYLRAINTDKTA